MKLRQSTPKIDCFIPYVTDTQFAEICNTLKEQPAIQHIYGITNTSSTKSEDNSELLHTDHLNSSYTMQMIAERCEADYCLFYQKPYPIELGFHALDRLLNIAEDTQASMIYADHYTLAEGQRIAHPVIDYQKGSLRDDFDFGSLVLISKAILKTYAKIENKPNYKFAGWYDLRLFLSRYYLQFRFLFLLPLVF